MKTSTNPQLGLLDTLMPSSPGNDFLEKLECVLDWRPIEAALQAMYPARTGRPPHAPLVLFKMCLLQHCYGLSDPQCEELVADRVSWRRFAGLGWQDAVPDETTLVRFRQRLREHGLHEELLALVNRQIEARGLILKTCTLVDATLLSAARRAPGRDEKGANETAARNFQPLEKTAAQTSSDRKKPEAPRTGGDPGADFAVRNGQIHYGYKAHIAVDETHTLIRRVTMTSARIQDCTELLAVVRGDEKELIADKAYWSRKHSDWCSERGITNGILRRAHRGEKLSRHAQRRNRTYGTRRKRIEKIFGWWKRSAAYRIVRYVGAAANRLELEFKSIAWNLKRLTKLIPA
jgi:IS5 family transposase